jgi:hypothetical protein
MRNANAIVRFAQGEEGGGSGTVPAGQISHAVRKKLKRYIARPA